MIGKKKMNKTICLLVLFGLLGLFGLSSISSFSGFSSLYGGPGYWSGLAPVPVLAGEPLPPEQALEALDPQIQKLKQEILDLNTLLFQLKEDLLFPEDSSIIIFLSIEGGNYFALDSLKIQLDDMMVTSYLYTEREVTALKKGGIQRLYTGNVKTGNHQLVAVFNGTGPQEKDYKMAEAIPFEKENKATFIKLIIRDDPVKKQPEFTYESWN